MRWYSLWESQMVDYYATSMYMTSFLSILMEKPCSDIGIYGVIPV